jgi:hypothetical protein
MSYLRENLGAPRARCSGSREAVYKEALDRLLDQLDVHPSYSAINPSTIDPAEDHFDWNTLPKSCYPGDISTQLPADRLACTKILT